MVYAPNSEVNWSQTWVHYLVLKIFKNVSARLSELVLTRGSPEINWLYAFDWDNIGIWTSCKVTMYRVVSDILLNWHAVHITLLTQSNTFVKIFIGEKCFGKLWCAVEIFPPFKSSLYIISFSTRVVLIYPYRHLDMRAEIKRGQLFITSLYLCPNHIYECLITVCILLHQSQLKRFQTGTLREIELLKLQPNDCSKL